MTNIVNLDEHRPHLSGKARCLDCRHEWQAVAPVGTLSLVCPNCTLDKGRFIYSVCKVDYPHFVCGCGNDLFHRTTRGYYCPNCGRWIDNDNGGNIA